MKNNQNGFIQIPLLIALVVLGLGATTLGSYYMVKKVQTKKVEVVVQTEGAKSGTKYTPLPDIGEKKSRYIPISGLSSSSDSTAHSVTSSPSSPKGKPAVLENPSAPKQPNLDDFKIKKEVTKTVDFQKLIAQAKEEVSLLEQDKNNFLLLRSTANSHKQKAIDHIKEMMNAWADLAGESTNKVPSEYAQLLRSTKEVIISDRDYVLESVNFYYGILDLYFWDSFKKRSEVDSIVSSQNEFNKCVELWENQKEDLLCKMLLELSSVDREGYAKDFEKITEKLVEVDNTILEIIANHANTAENRITNDFNSISRMIGTVNSFQATLDNISQQAQRSSVQTVFGAQLVRCYTTTNDPILAQNRTYSTTCEPYTQTAAQVCAAAKAARLSAGAYIQDSQPDPACE